MHDIHLSADDLMEEARAAAQENDTSDQVLNSLIAEGLLRQRASRRMRDRAGAPTPDKIMHQLREFATAAPQPDDEIPIEG